MVSPLSGDPRIDLLHQALTGLARRQQAIAGNIANVDTPGYTRKDVAFESELRTAAGGGGRLAVTDSRHIRGTSAGGGLLTSLVGADETRTSTSRNDGNDVDIDYEMTRLAETSLRYGLLTQATSSRLLTLKDIATRAS
jgi:flagellar basal-body rod protein FlgB